MEASNKFSIITADYLENCIPHRRKLIVNLGKRLDHQKDRLAFVCLHKHLIPVIFENVS
jgi:hypothetical protein